MEKYAVTGLVRLKTVGVIASGFKRTWIRSEEHLPNKRRVTKCIPRAG